MPRPCTVCKHESREIIDEMLMVKNDSFREVSGRFGLARSSLQRHKAEHIPKRLAKAQEAEVVAEADDLLAKVLNIEQTANRIAKRAEEEGDLRTAISGCRELARLVELLAKLQGVLKEGTTVNVLVQPQWIQTRNVIVEALRDFPDARIAVADALHRIEGQP